MLYYGSFCAEVVMKEVVIVALRPIGCQERWPSFRRRAFSEYGQKR